MPAPMNRRLSAATLACVKAGVALPCYDRATTGVGIVHFGPGAFHRAHQACYVDDLLVRDPRWAISEVSLHSVAVKSALEPQDGLFTVAQLDAETHLRIIGAIREVLTAAVDRERVFARLTSPAVKLVTLTVTEKGYCLGADGDLDLAHPDVVRDLAAPAAPASIIGWLTEGLARRRAAGLSPFVTISCDNVVSNGPKLRHAVIRLAQARGDGALAEWIANEARFPTTMVDSIAPATDDGLKTRVAEGIGLRDEAPVQRESFRQWVIEDILGPEAPDFASVGATLTRDVAAYERAKLRLLNGAHSTLAYAGLLLGHDTVSSAMADPLLAGFVERMMRRDVAPTLPATPGFDIPAYIDSVLARFRNPALVHRLRQIACDGSQKLPYRILGTVRDALAAGRPVDRLAVPLAAWMRFVVGETRAGRVLDDPLAGPLGNAGRAATGDAPGDVALFFALPAVLPADLVGKPDLVAAVAAAYRDIGAALGR